jgi:hypothetical protein
MLRLSAAEMLIAAPLNVLAAAGLAPSAKSVRASDVQVIEVANSLQLREVLGLTAPSNQAHERTIVH